jgi:Ca2+-binding RTX toxin-like protein
MRSLRVLAALPLAAAMLLPVSAAAHPDPVEVPEDCAVPPEDIDLTQYNVVIGTNKSETLKGTKRADFICGRLGNDRIFGFGGDDILLADTTTFFGDPGAAGGHDVVFAGWGNDEVLPGPGNDKVYGARGADFLALALGNDRGYGGFGADTIIGGFGRDRIFGNPGADVLVGGFDNDLINGGLGDDQLAGELPPGSPPPPVPFEPALNDVCIGYAGFDTAIDCDRLFGIEG